MIYKNKFYVMNLYKVIFLIIKDIYNFQNNSIKKKIKKYILEIMILQVILL